MKTLFIFAAWVVVGVLLVVVGIGGWQYYQHQLDPGDDQPSFQTGTDTNHDTVAAKPVDGDVRSGNATAARTSELVAAIADSGAAIASSTADRFEHVLQRLGNIAEPPAPRRTAVPQLPPRDIEQEMRLRQREKNLIRRQFVIADELKSESQPERKDQETIYPGSHGDYR